MLLYTNNFDFVVPNEFLPCISTVHSKKNLVLNYTPYIYICPFSGVCIHLCFSLFIFYLFWEFSTFFVGMTVCVWHMTAWKICTFSLSFSFSAKRFFISRVHKSKVYLCVYLSVSEEFEILASCCFSVRNMRF